MDTILVTGAGGFIGSHMGKFLKKKGKEVIGVDIKEPKYMKKDEVADKFFVRDLRNQRICVELTQDIDRVYNFSANMGGIGFITSELADVMHDNVKINANLLNACVGNDVERFFFASSACVYPHEMQDDSSEVVNLKEDDALPASPGTAYGWEKLFTERMCDAFEEDYGIETRVARFHNIYGSRGTYEGGREKAPQALARKVAKAEDGDSVTVWGDGGQIRSFLYIDDAVVAIEGLMNSEYGDPLNIGSDEPIRINELVDLLIDISGKNLSKSYDPTKPVGVRSRNADLSKVKRAIDWEPSVDYREGMRKTYEWIKERVPDG